MLLEQLREQVVIAARGAERSGLCKHKSGNVSAFDPETGYLCITPSGADREHMTPDEICVVDDRLHVIEGGTPSSETMMHAACYRARPDLRALVHTHSLYATSFAIVNRPVPAVAYEMFIFHVDNAVIPVAPFAIAGSEALAKSVAETMKRSDLVLMERHGAIAGGSDPEAALLGASYIEEFATLYFNALMIGKQEPPAFTQAELDAWRFPDRFS